MRWLSVTANAILPMKNGVLKGSRGRAVELAETHENRLKLVPNQALYQAEPQPENRFTARRGALLLRVF